MNDFEKTIRHHWGNFLMLEDGCKTLFRYIEPNSDNRHAYGSECAKLILACGSEVDVVLKLLYEIASPEQYWASQRKGDSFEGKLNIFHFREFVRESREWSFKDVRVKLVTGDWVATPWESWWDAKPKSPDWWDDYNKVKHDRGSEFNRASLETAFNSLAALFIAIVDLARAAGVMRLKPPPALLLFDDDTRAEASFAEVDGGSLYMETSISLHVKPTPDEADGSDDAIRARLELVKALRDMGTSEGLSYLDR